REQRPAAAVRRGFTRPPGGMRQAAAPTEGGGPRRQQPHLVQVAQRYRPGLFHCYTTAGLPRTNNDLEHLFGSHRYHERRASGRKGASPGLVVMGSVRVVAALAARPRPGGGLG